MRNLTKVLALVLALTMMVSVAGFAASYTDVASDANYAEAVSVLSDLGLVKGYEDGTFGADKTLTRAEAATLVVRLMGLEDAAISAAGSETGFTDVAADHWASGYIYIAAQKNVVAGMGDGTFEPETELEYAQIVKMIVVALGYAPQAAEAGEWPGNYISTASNIGLTKGIPGKATDKATRATTARLLYAALTIPKMEKSGVGVNATYEPVDKMILDELGIYKLLGSVSTVDTVNEKATISVDKQGLIIDQKYKETADDNNWSWDPDQTIVETGALAATLKDMQGVPAYIYVADADGDYVVVAVVERKNVSSVAFASDDWEDYDADKQKLSYYTNAEQTKTASVKLADEVTVRINGGDADTYDAQDFSDLVENGAFAVDLKDTAESDDLYDYANLTMYQYMVVSEVSANKAGVYTIESEVLTIADDLCIDQLKIDTDNDETAITIIKDGEIVDVDAIAEEDILNVVVNELEDDELIEGTIYVTNDTVDSIVRYVDDEDGIISMTDGSEYKYLITDDIDSQTEATFFLSISGKIIYMSNETAKSSYTYGYASNIILSGKSNAMKTGTIRVLSTEGEWATLDLKTTFTVNGESVKITDLEDADDVAALEETFDAVDYAADAREPEFAINGVVAYKLDSTGAVKEIVVVNAANDDDLEDNVYGYTKEFKADEDEPSFGAYLVDETTVVFNVAESAEVDSCSLDEGDITVTDISIFKDDTEYTANLIKIDEKTDVVAIMIGTFQADIDFEAPLFVVSKALSETLADFNDKEVITLTGFENGEEVVYYVSSDDESEVVAVASEEDDDENTWVAAGASIDAPYAKASYYNGQIMIVNADANGFIAKAVVLGDVADFADEEVYDYDAIEAIKGDLIDGDDNGWVVTGFVAARNSTKTKVWLDVDNAAIDDDEAIAELKGDDEAGYGIKNAVVTVYDFTQKTANRISAGTVSDIDEGTIIIGRADEDYNLKEVIVIITEETDNY